MILIFGILSFLAGMAIILVRNKTFTRNIVMFYTLLHVAFSVYCWLHPGKTEFIYFTFDQAGVLLLSILSVLTISTVYHGFIYVKDETPKLHAIYHTALIFLITAMSGSYLANGMVTVWIFVEATTLTVAALIYHDRTVMALEATWKYIFVCSVGIALAYIGVLFLGFTMEKSNMLNLSFAALSDVINKANPLYLKISFIFILIGYSTKMGLFPMHTVTVDAHTVAPAPISAFISTTLMNVGFLAIFRMYALFSSTAILPFMNHVLILSGLFSLLIASGYMLKAKHNKRMLAYSSLENMGIVAIALGVGGIGYYAAFLHIILHSFTKAGMFYQLGQSYKVMGTYHLDESGGYMKSYPLGAIVMLLGLLCLTAIPPSGMFISEFYLFQSMAEKGQYIYLIVTALLLCFVVYALTVRVLHIVYSEPLIQKEFAPVKINPVQTISQFILFGLVIIICFIQPVFLKNLINGIIQNLPK